jgi:formylglycine-generating enzyme required for sulfatase activity
VLDDFIRQYGNAPIYGALAREKREALVNNPGRSRPPEPAKDQVAMAVDPAAGSATPLTAARERALKPKDIFKECADCPEMVVVPAGSFTMGSQAGEKGHTPSEGPEHVVTIGKRFAVGKLHVTVDQFAAFVQATGHQDSKCHNGEGFSGSWRDPGFAQEGSHPVVCVSWDDAKAYVDWMAKKTGKPYRLLSEAEWEYAARGRTSPGAYPRFWFGEDEEDLCRYGNFKDRKAGKGDAPCDDGYANTSPSGHYQPNAFGLFDMFGNAWQWMEDCWYNYTDADAQTALTSNDCRRRVLRGGSWRNDPSYLRAAKRRGTRGRDADDDFGFRVARSVNGPDAEHR